MSYLKLLLSVNTLHLEIYACWYISLLNCIPLLLCACPQSHKQIYIHTSHLEFILLVLEIKIEKKKHVQFWGMDIVVCVFPRTRASYSGWRLGVEFLSRLKEWMAMILSLPLDHTSPWKRGVCFVIVKKWGKGRNMAWWCNDGRTQNRNLDSKPTCNSHRVEVS